MKIKSLYLFSFIFAILNISCNDSSPAEAVTQVEHNAIHKKVEFYLKLSPPHIRQAQSLGPHMRSKDLANKRSWQLRLSPMKDKTTKYEFNITYIDSTTTADNYEAEVIFKSTNGPVKETYSISYDGTEQVIHSVSNAIACEAGIRPKEKTK